MPKIVLNPEIENNIKIIEYADYAYSGYEKQKELMNFYESGYLLVLRGYKFLPGKDFFHSISFPNTKSSKKIFLSTPDNPHNDGAREKEWSMVNNELLAGDEKLKSSFYTNVVSANTEVFRLVDSLFPHYKYTRRLCVYNLTEMLCHNMHFDSPQHADECTQVRMFVNIDSFPRIWHLGESLEVVADRHYEHCNMQGTIGEHSREFTKRLTAGVYGGRYESGSRPVHKHSIAFQPGEVWFLNPNMAAHEIVYGRRLLDGIFMFDKKDLLQKDRFYPTLVRNIHKNKVGTWGEKGRRFFKIVKKVIFFSR